MSNYVKATDFASKDALLTGDPLKIVSGTEINDEFNAIQTAVNTKADINSPTLTGAPSAPTAGAGTNTTQLATTAFVKTADDNLTTTLTAVIQALYPIGTIYTNSSDSTNPATLLGFGTWVAFGAGRVPVGLDSGNALFDTAEETGGSYDAVNVSHTHTASVTDPGHDHNLRTKRDSPTDLFSGTGDYLAGDTNEGALSQSTSFNQTWTESVVSNTTGVTVSNSTEGVSGTNQNIQPYITVYMWKRTA